MCAYFCTFGHVHLRAHSCMCLFICACMCMCVFTKPDEGSLVYVHTFHTPYSHLHVGGDRT